MHSIQAYNERMEKIVQRSLLYDFYGELLTEHQRRIYSAVVFDDYSVSEIAREEGISRQGVHDLMKRCDKTLEDYEERLHLLERFLRVRESVRRIQKITEKDAGAQPKEMKEIGGIAASILEEL